MEKQLVIFELAGEYFGIDIASVEGIVKMQKITKVPKASDYIEGITNLRGSVLPVIDLGKRFNVDHKVTPETRIVVINMDGVKIGMIVASVSEVLTIDENVIETTPTIITNLNTEFMTGVAKIDSRLVILLDLTRVLSSEEKAEAASLAK